VFFFQAEDGIRDFHVTGVQTCALPILWEIDGKSVYDLFTYSVKESRPVSRTTIAQRVSALSSFWNVLMFGENRPGGEPILQYNIWGAVKKRVSRGLSGLKKEASRKQKMPPEQV